MNMQVSRASSELSGITHVFTFWNMIIFTRWLTHNFTTIYSSLIRFMYSLKTIYIKYLLTILKLIDVVYIIYIHEVGK